MTNLNEINKTLAMVVQASGLADETPLDLHSVQESTKRLAAACSDCGCEQVRLESRLLEDSVGEMNTGPGASSALKFFIQLESTILQIENDLAASPSATAWWTGQRLAEVGSAIDKFLDAESDSGWRAIRETICHLDAMRSGMAELSKFLALPLGGEIRGFDQLLELLEVAQEKLKGDSAAELCYRVWCTRPKLDAQLQILWYQTHLADQTEVDSAEAYAWAWNDLLMNSGVSVTPKTCYAAAERARFTAITVGLNDVAEFVSDPERLMDYSMANILPPAPSPWRLSSTVEIELFLKNELARWYFRPYRFELQPLDLIGAVVRLRRPLFYERLLAHSLLQFHVVQTCLFANVEVGYLNVLVALAKSIDVLLAGYQLRIESMPKLKRVDGWAEYLESVVHVHFHNPGTMGWTPLSNKLLFSGESN